MRVLKSALHGTGGGFLFSRPPCPPSFPPSPPGARPPAPAAAAFFPQPGKIPPLTLLSRPVREERTFPRSNGKPGKELRAFPCIEESTLVDGLEGAQGGAAGRRMPLGVVRQRLRRGRRGAGFFPLTCPPNSLPCPFMTT